jgi:hypothetical protein
MAETKKLCLAVCGAEEVASAMRSRGQSFEVNKLFHQELQNQILAFALMRVLPDHVVKTSMQAAGAAAQADSSGTVSAAGRLARELEQAAGENEETVKAVQEALLAQPLFRLASQQPQVFANLEQQYEKCAAYAATLMGTLKSSMGMLVNAAANAAAAGPGVEAAAQEAQAKPPAPPTEAAAQEAQTKPQSEAGPTGPAEP